MPTCRCRPPNDQWREFEKFPQFMIGVKQSTETDTHRLYWKTEIAGKGVVTFKPISDVMSTVVLQLACTPESIVERIREGVKHRHYAYRKS